MTRKAYEAEFKRLDVELTQLQRRGRPQQDKIRVGRETMRRRGEPVERFFAHILDRSGTRRVWLHGRENVRKRYLIHVAGVNIGVLMRALNGWRTPKEAAKSNTFVFGIRAEAVLIFGLGYLSGGEIVAAPVLVACGPALN